MATTFDPRMHLAMQMDFLVHSCAIFDRGGHCRNEAIRIAAVLRTLFRDAFRGKTQHTKSVFSHLKERGFGEPTLLSTAALIPPNAVMANSTLSKLSVNCGPMGATYVPCLDSGPAERRWVDSETWWTEAICVVGSQAKSLARRDIVLAAAEQDGGVHVDEDLDASYQLVKAGLWQVRAADGTLEAVPDAHLADLRQMAHEVLSSPRIREMVKR